MNRRELLDLYYLEARAKLIDVAAFLDRLDRAEGAPDFRLAAFTQALLHLEAGREPRVERVLARCRPVLADGGDCVLVAHGHVLRILTARWLGLPPIDGRLFALDPARLSALGSEHEQPVISCWNATTRPL